MNKVYLIFIVLFISIYCSLTILPQTAFGIKSLKPEIVSKKQGHSKINIKSDSLLINNKTGVATFSGNVVAIKGKLKILSNVLNVEYTKENKIKILIATGNVHIIKGKDNITGGKAIYYNKTKIAVITENPVAYEDKNKIIGEKIIINFKTNISTVSGSPSQRVNATVYSNKSLSVKPADKGAKSSVTKPNKLK